MTREVLHIIDSLSNQTCFFLGDSSSSSCVLFILTLSAPPLVCSLWGSICTETGSRFYSTSERSISSKIWITNNKTTTIIRLTEQLFLNTARSSWSFHSACKYFSLETEGFRCAVIFCLGGVGGCLRHCFCSVCVPPLSLTSLWPVLLWTASTVLGPGVSSCSPGDM